jgi:hypothetical protein
VGFPGFGDAGDALSAPDGEAEAEADSPGFAL